jgi:hypothetical protein
MWAGRRRGRQHRVCFRTSDVHPDGRRFVLVQSPVASRIELIPNRAAQLRASAGR